MRKSPLFLIIALWCSVMADAAAPLAAMQNASRTYSPVFYGALEQSNEWADNKGLILKTGIYRFDLDPLTSFTPCSAQSASATVTHGGTYADGFFYYLNGVLDRRNINMTFNKMSVDTWKVVHSSGHYSPTLTYASCLAHDYTTGNTYAVCPEETDGNLTGKYCLRSVDLETGEFTNIGYVDVNFPAIAVDADGQLWGVGREAIFPFSVSLYKIDKTTGSITLVGPLGYLQKSLHAAATFDIKTGKLYWAARTYTYNEYFEERYSSHIFEVDTTTGAATPVKDFGYEEVMHALFMIDNHPDAPDSPSDVKFTFATGSYREGNLTATLPTTTYRGGTISGKLSATVYVDDNEISTATGLTPGSEFTSPAMTLTDGKHKLKVSVTDENHRTSLIASTDVYAGADLPARVNNLNVSLDQRAATATLTWTAPTAGMNGGELNIDNVTYTVIRRPEGTVIASGIKELTLTDTPDREMGITQYEVVGTVDGSKGQAAYSDLVVVGQPRTVPYLETFDTSTSFMSYIQIDANGDGSENGNCWLYYPAYREAVWWVNYNDMGKADDWMVSPGVQLSTDRVYRLSFSTHGYGTASNSSTTFEVYAGPEPTVESMKHLIVKESFKALQSGRIMSEVFRPEATDFRFGFHAINDGTDHIALDNVRIIDYGPVTIPTAPTDIQTSRCKDGRIAISTKAPETAMDGSALPSLTAIKVYRASNGQVIASAQNPAPGAVVTLYDEEARSGVNEYILVAQNDSGEGVQAYGMINNITPKPQSVTNLKIRAVDSDAVLTWEMPSFTSSSGEAIDPEDIRYRITRQGRLGDAVEIASACSETTYTDKNLDLVLGSAQELVTYTVTAFTEGGSAAAQSVKSIVGRPLDLPYEFKFDDYNHNWFNLTGYGWSIRTTGYDPIVRGGVDDSYLVSFTGSSREPLISPRMNFTSLLNPKLTFHLYCSKDTKYNRGQVRVAIERLDNDGNVMDLEYLPGAYNVAADTDGWQKIEIDLSDFSSAEAASVVLVPIPASKGYIHIDNVTVTGNRPADDPRITVLSGSANAIAGRDNVYTVVLNNNGTNPCTTAQVRFTAGEQEISTVSTSVGAGENREIQFAYHPELRSVGEIVPLTAEVTADADDNTTNNSFRFRVEITAPVLPYVNTLSAETSDEKVSLSWEEASDYPMSLSVTEGFDSYSDFMIDGISPWKLVDQDGAVTMGGISTSAETFTWSNAGTPQAYIVFNPKAALVTGLCTAYSGDKCLVSFASAAPNNDDWLISPLLHTAQQTITFYARAIHPFYCDETIEVLASRSADNVSDFTTLVEKITVNSNTWHRYSVTLPAGTTHFAIRCTSANQFGLMLDDITYIPAQAPVELWGYNVYRDDRKIASELPDVYFEDTEGAFGEIHSYNVTALYASGESVYSNTVRAGRGAAAIGSVSSDGQPEVTADHSNIIVTGANGQILTVTDATGRTIYSFRASATESLPVLPGIYLVTIDGKTWKVAVR